MVPWPLFLKRLAGTFGLCAGVYLFIIYWNTEDIEHLWTLGGIWALCHIAITIVNMIWRDR